MPNLYVTEQGARLQWEYGRILVTKGRDVLLDVPAIKVSEIVLVGRVGVTTPALQMLLQHEIGMALLSSTGEFLGRLSGDRHSNTDLKRAQYRRGDDADFCLQVARAVTSGKLWNCRVRCLRTASHTASDVARRAADRISRHLRELEHAQGLVSVRALEAQGARAYFSCIRDNLHKDWQFPSRQRRPPPDPFNAILSACYTLLTEAVYSAAFLAGLDPYCGFYHSERWGRPALALDLMEEFRPIIADSVAVTLVNRQVLSQADFRPGPPERPVILSQEGYRKLLRKFGERLRAHVTVPRLRQRTTYQRLLEYQARRLAAVIEGREPTYEPFRSR